MLLLILKRGKHSRQEQQDVIKLNYYQIFPCFEFILTAHPKGAKKIVLAGNPNVGKSIFFNYFTGIYVAVSNYPGTTLSINAGQYKDYYVIDTPGVYGVSSFNDEEIVARDIIMTADMIIRTRVFVRNFPANVP